jgi:hypothetical protein
MAMNICLVSCACVLFLPSYLSRLMDRQRILAGDAGLGNDHFGINVSAPPADPS